MTPLTPVAVVVAGAGALALFGLLLATWRSGRRRGRTAVLRTQRLTRAGTAAGRAVLAAALIVAVQWAVLLRTEDRLVTAVALGLPALLAGATVARLLSLPTRVRAAAREVRR
ncbi:hypothetical protein GCM10012275_62380 [Longimycelium tulufanense]|uniref:Uncharacterized protein n=1 Tax=Longimycelium tulufanense TaxID=907463 RepID=A0A8J3FZS3_9PSEU|nr:hypothetical protein [Longimycelium tulufanense]GGM83273.1 hypothetical protein GCM10012275_62380 [Longimycelium tulufanense]